MSSITEEIQQLQLKLNNLEKQKKKKKKKMIKKHLLIIILESLIIY